MRFMMRGGLSTSLRFAIVAKPMNEPIAGGRGQEAEDGLTLMRVFMPLRGRATARNWGADYAILTW
jgi:hypothetical protein